MNASRIKLFLHAYASALVAADARPLAVIRAMEQGLPGLRLAWTIDAEGFVPEPEGDARVSVRIDDGGFALYCNGDEENLVTLSGLEIPAGLSPGRKPQLDIYAKWPLDMAGPTAAADVLEGIAEAAHANWAHVTPDNAADFIWEQKIHTRVAPPRSPRGLPMLKLANKLHSPYVPFHLGWLNYWSAATAQTIGFPDQTRDAELLLRSKRTKSGGWIVQLTETPMDLDNPAHFQALLLAYERFPEIGGRNSD